MKSAFACKENGLGCGSYGGVHCAYWGVSGAPCVEICR